MKVFKIAAVGAAGLALSVTALLPAVAGGTNAAAALGNYDVRGYTNSTCNESGYKRLVVGAGHSYGIKSIKVGANGYFTTDLPSKPNQSYRANTCVPVNNVSDWTDTHIYAQELP
jgi:hypothetical protein